jgi:hypothetical protein
VPGFSQVPQFHAGTNKEGLPEVNIQLPEATEDEGEVKIAFTFASRGFLGPSSDPGNQDGFANPEGTLFGVTYQPETKSGFVKLFLMNNRRKLLFLGDVNGEVAGLLKGRWSNVAKYFLRIESIKGNTVHLQAVDFETRERESFEFSVTVRPNGTISLSR